MLVSISSTPVIGATRSPRQNLRLINNFGGPETPDKQTFTRIFRAKPDIRNPHCSSVLVIKYSHSTPTAESPYNGRGR